MIDRPDWDTYYLDLAHAVAQRAACTRSQVGAVITQDNRLIAAGYNGAPPGERHCTDGGCPRGLLTYEEAAKDSNYDNCIALHAEVNALANATAPVRGATIYITRPPCPWCAKVLTAFGIERTVTP